MATEQMVRVMNISDEHIGTARPAGLFLRRKGHKPTYLTWAVIPEHWVDSKMRDLETERRLRIQPVDKDGKVIPTAREQSEALRKAAEEPETTVVTAQETVVEEPEKSPEKQPITVTAKSTAKSKAEDAAPITVTAKSTAKVEAEDAAPKTADSAVVNLAPPPKPNDTPTVASGEDGAPVVNTPTDEDPSPEAAGKDDGDKAPEDQEEGKETAVSYTRDQLKKMNLRELREVLDQREINIDSTRKDPIIEAILDHQNLGG